MSTPTPPEPGPAAHLEDALACLERSFKHLEMLDTFANTIRKIVDRLANQLARRADNSQAVLGDQQIDARQDLLTASSLLTGLPPGPARDQAQAEVELAMGKLRLLMPGVAIGEELRRLERALRLVSDLFDPLSTQAAIQHHRLEDAKQQLKAAQQAVIAAAVQPVDNG